MSGKLRGLGGKRPVSEGPSEEELLALVPGGLATAFVNARMHDRALALAGLGEPSDWDGEMPELPEDIASEDHDSLSNLLGAVRLVPVHLHLARCQGVHPARLLQAGG